MANLIASGTTPDTSADFTVVAGTPVTIHLIDADGGALPAGAGAVIDIKSSLSQYRQIKGGDLHALRPEIVLDAPGTFRVRKFASTVAFGVDKE